MRILIVGAGAVGGYFGGRLSEAGRDVTFLIRPARAEQLARDGLRIVSPHGNAVLTPKLVRAGEITAPYDLVFLSVKAYSLEKAVEDFAAAVGPGTTILPVLNGMSHMDILAARFGEHAVIGGVCLVATEVDKDGRIIQSADFQHLAYGEKDGATTPRLQAIDAALRGAGFDARLAKDILQAMWEKWVQLASIGAITCLMRGAIGEIVAVPGGTELSLGVLKECAAIATQCGYKPSEAFLARQTAAMTAQGSPMTTSMYRDLRKGAPVEVDQILGDLINRGAAHGIEAPPILTAAYVNLHVYQNGLHARAPG